MKKFLIVLAVVVAIGGWLFSEYWFYLPGIISGIVNPVGENQPVSWQSGPAEPASGDRPPNIVLIVADDLGYNDITFYGGGIADASVPTPSIDSIARDGIHFSNGYAGNGTNLNDDPTEQHNLSGSHPQRLESLRTALSALDQQMAEPLWPALVEARIAVDYAINRLPDTEYETILWSN